MRSCDRRAVADRSAISWGKIGNWLTIGWRLFLERMFTIATKVHDCLETSRQQIGDRSAISRRLKTVLGLSATTATGRRPVADQSPDLAAERFHFQQAKLPCDQIVLVTFLRLLQPVCDQSATSLWLPSNLPVTARKNGRKVVADRLQPMCDRGFRRTSQHYWCTVYSSIISTHT